MGGKSARTGIVMYLWGKPYLEQDKIGMAGLFVPKRHAGMSHR